MSLGARKVKTMIETHADQMIAELNSEFGTSISIETDWEFLSGSEQWNWDDSRLQLCFNRSYIDPVKNCFTALCSDDMYKEAIQQQVKAIKILPKSCMFPDVDFVDGALILTHTMSPNQGDTHPNPQYLKTVSKKIEDTINGKLN